MTACCRRREQDDPDLYLHVVGRDSTGVTIRGAKFHTTAGPLVHELVVMPTKRMKAGEEDYAIACAVPANTPGVIQIATCHHPWHADPRDKPVSGAVALPDSMVIFDDVHVPYDRVFLDGDVANSATVAHALGLWERLSGVAHMAHLGDQLVGLAQLMAEANGTAGVGHIKEKITEIVLYATMTRACLEAALGNVDINADGMLVPSELYTNAGKLHAATEYAVMVRHLHDIAGGTAVTGPSFADMDNPDTGRFVEKYLRGAGGVTASERLALFHTIRNMTADDWGGREAVSWLQSGGGLFAQRTVTRNHYDMDHAKQLARVAHRRQRWLTSGSRSSPVAPEVSDGRSASGCVNDGWCVLATYRSDGDSAEQFAADHEKLAVHRPATWRSLPIATRRCDTRSNCSVSSIMSCAAAAIAFDGLVVDTSDDDWDSVVATEPQWRVPHHARRVAPPDVHRPRPHRRDLVGRRDDG